jgi:exportin-7
MRPLTSAASIWGDTPEVMNPLLKFYMELVNTKGMRIKFPPSSANGILLFREISSVVVAYGNTLLRQQKPTDTNQEYSHWYKGKKKQWCSFAVDRVVLH